MRVLVTGATGYIGGRLVPQLLERGHEVTVLVRDPRRAVRRAWSEGVTVRAGDLLDRKSLDGAFDGIDTAYYLVHSMYSGADFATRDRDAATHFAAAAAGLPRLVYLGGLLPHEGRRPSAHLASRAETGRVLRDALPTTEVRAGPIIGSGSASFEMVRYLTERLPMMVAPRWILNRVQPIGVADVLRYLVLASERDALGVVDVGADVLTFRGMMLQYAEERGLRRMIIPVPVLAPSLAARWVGAVTPLPNSIAVPLIEGVVNSVLADTTLARKHFPEVEPIPYRESVARALQRTTNQRVMTAWSDALNSAPSYELTDREGLIRETRTVESRATVEQLYETVASLGGDRGWLAWDWAWRLRGLLDRLVGGPGLRRGRRDKLVLLPGEAVDFWRVEVSEPPRRLRLRAEMKVPGQAWLQWEIAPTANGSALAQTATFAPRGLAGALYWYLLYPIHKLIFSAMARAIAREAERG
ncbi:SDR family oxidoreductase [soil metagenome]